MPELPEVEVTRKLCVRHLRDRSIVKATVQKDPIVSCGQDPEFIRNALVGRRVLDCHRRGKYFWWELQDHGALLLHLGMTGAVHVPDGPALSLSHGIDFEQGQWPPRFTKLDLELSDGQRLAFCDPRRFGRVQWQQDPCAQAPVGELGIDPVAQELTWSYFDKALERRKGTIKGLLLNQRFIAGLGNWIADEVLYQAQIDPRSPIPRIPPEKRRALFDAITQVLRIAVQVDADATRFPDTWLFHHRWGKKSGAKDSEGAVIEFIQVAGRTTAWVPGRQQSFS